MTRLLALAAFAALGCGGPSASSKASADPAKEALADYVGKTAADVPALLKELASRDEPTRVRAAHFLSQIGPAAASAAPALAKALDDPSEEVRLAAAHALGCFGPAASAAAPKLQALASRAPAGPKEVLETALRRIEGKEEHPK